MSRPQQDASEALAELQALARLSNDVARLASKVIPYPEYPECLKWTGSINQARGGYGQIGHTVNRFWVPTIAQRFAYELYHGEIPDGHAITQTCGRHDCVRFSHLNAVLRVVPPIERFWRKITEDAINDCWIWNGKRFYHYVEGQRYRAARYAFMITHRELKPEELLIRTCSNERCVNPDHHRVTDLLSIIGRQLTPAKVRFMALITPAANGCWIWDGAKPDGNPQFYIGGEQGRTPARRWIYEQTFRTIGPGLYVRQTCESPYCVNPEHLTLSHRRSGPVQAQREPAHAQAT